MKTLVSFAQLICLKYEFTVNLKMGLSLPGCGGILKNVIQGVPEWRRIWKKLRLVRKAFVVADEQMVNWERKLKCCLILSNVCTLDGRVAFWSSARRAKLKIFCQHNITLYIMSTQRWKLWKNHCIQHTHINIWEYRDGWRVCHVINRGFRQLSKKKTIANISLL